MKVKTHVKAGQVVLVVGGQGTGEGDIDNRGGVSGILNVVNF